VNYDKFEIDEITANQPVRSNRGFSRFKEPGPPTVRAPEGPDLESRRLVNK